MSCDTAVTSGISIPFGMLSPSKGQVAYALLTRSPLRIEPKLNSPFDLHVLGTPPAFVLSQDQTLYKMVSNRTFTVRYDLLQSYNHSFIFYSYESRQLTEPSLAAFRRYPVISHEISTAGAFFFVTLFNLQGARRSAERCYYTGSSSRLSSLFFNFFCGPLSLLRNSSIRLPHFHAACQVLFSKP